MFLILSHRELSNILGTPQNALVQQCMEDDGFDIHFVSPLPAKGASIDIRFRRYGVPESLQDALDVGYGLPQHALHDPDAVEALQQAGDSYSDVEQEALMGPPEALPINGRRNGCFGKADHLLMGASSVVEASGLAQPQLVRDINLDPRALDSQDSREAIQQFAQCMADAGYPDIGHPLDDRPAQFRTNDLENPSEAEKQSAVVRFDCMNETQVREAMYAAESAFQQQAIEDNPESFAQIRQELDDIIRRATEILAEGPS